MRAPRFWDTPSTGRLPWQAHALSPLAALWRWQTARRLRTPPRYTAPVPVICIGNLNVGGTGKTPVVQDLVTGLAEKGLRPVVLSRGYGGQIAGPVAVVPADHTARDVGDEPLLLAQFTPVWVARDRAMGARAVVEAGAGDVIVLDDGFQNPTLAKDLSVLVVDAERGFGNGRVMPAGPLREPVAAGLSRAAALVTMGPASPGRQLAQSLGPQAPPHLSGELAPLQTGLSLAGAPVIAFAGIGRPERFFASLRDQGADLIATHPLADHAPLADAFLRRVIQDARARGARVMTTEKDAMRLPDWARREVQVLPVRVQWHGQNLMEFCATALGL